MPLLFLIFCLFAFYDTRRRPRHKRRNERDNEEELKNTVIRAILQVKLVISPLKKKKEGGTPRQTNLKFLFDFGGSDGALLAFLFIFQGQKSLLLVPLALQTGFLFHLLLLLQKFLFFTPFITIHSLLGEREISPVIVSHVAGPTAAAGLGTAAGGFVAAGAAAA